jgi:hypothetical protein
MRFVNGTAAGVKLQRRDAYRNHTYLWLHQYQGSESFRFCFEETPNPSLALASARWNCNGSHVVEHSLVRRERPRCQQQRRATNSCVSKGEGEGERIVTDRKLLKSMKHHQHYSYLGYCVTCHILPARLLVDGIARQRSVSRDKLVLESAPITRPECQGHSNALSYRYTTCTRLDRLYQIAIIAIAIADQSEHPMYCYSTTWTQPTLSRFCAQSTCYVIVQAGLFLSGARRGRYDTIQ